MDMPWYGWLVSYVLVWAFGFTSGRASGQVFTLRFLAAEQAKTMQIPGLPPNMPGPGGR